MDAELRGCENPGVKGGAPTIEPRVRTGHRFNDQALPTAGLYFTLLPASRIESVELCPEGGDMIEDKKVLVVEFFPAGAQYQAVKWGSARRGRIDLRHHG